MTELEKWANEFAGERAEKRKAEFPLCNPAAFDNEAMWVRLGFVAGARAMREKCAELADYQRMMKVYSGYVVESGLISLQTEMRMLGDAEVKE